MSQNNAQIGFAYDAPTAVTRLREALAANSAGSGALTGKFYAHAALRLFGVLFNTLVAGTSTYTVAGTATAQATQLNAIYITNTSTTGGVALSTTTLGPFTVGGTSTAGTNVSVGGVGGLAGGYQGPYALNTLGGTNTSQVWGTNTFVSGTATGSQIQSGYPGSVSIGFGGLPMGPGDVLYFVNGTDATAVVLPVLQFTYDSNNALVVR